MNKRIRVNGVLYEAVNPRHNRRSTSPMNESYGKKVTEHDLYYMGLGGCYSMPWGPCVEWDNGEVQAVLSSLESRPVPSVFVQTLDADYESGIPSFAASTPEDYYSADEDGYEDASDDFQSICKALDSGSTLKQVARRFHLETFDL